MGATEVNYSDRGSRFQSFACFAPATRVVTRSAPRIIATLVNPDDQRVTAESPTSLVPLSCVSFFEHQSDATVPRVPFADQDSVSATVGNSCPEPMSFESECLNCVQFSSILLMSPKRLVVAPIPTTVVFRPRLQQPHSRARVLKLCFL